MMTNSTSQEKVVFLAKAMISANDAVDNLRDKVKIQSTLWTILFFIGCVTFDLTKSKEIINEKFFVFWTQLFFNFKHDLNILLRDNSLLFIFWSVDQFFKREHRSRFYNSSSHFFNFSDFQFFLIFYFFPYFQLPNLHLIFFSDFQIFLLIFFFQFLKNC